MRSTQLKNIYLQELLNILKPSRLSSITYLHPCKFKGINDCITVLDDVVVDQLSFSLCSLCFIQNSHFNLEQVKICYFGSFMGAMFPREDTANKFIVCGLCNMELWYDQFNDKQKNQFSRDILLLMFLL